MMLNLVTAQHLAALERNAGVLIHRAGCELEPNIRYRSGQKRFPPRPQPRLKRDANHFGKVGRLRCSRTYLPAVTKFITLD